MQRVLILCTGNSCRSQMAEALWEQLGRGRWQSESAGSRPSGYVHPLAIRAMQELGLDISDYEQIARPVHGPAVRSRRHGL